MRIFEFTGVSQSEELSSLEPIDLRAIQISQLFADLRGNLLVSLLGGLMLVALLWGVVSSYCIFIWLAIHWVLLATRFILAWRFGKRSPSGEAALRWGQWLIALVTIAGLWWGMSGILLFPTGSAPHQFLLALVLGGAALAHVRMHAALLECSAFPGILILLPICARLIYEGQETSFLAGLVLTIFSIGLVFVAYRINNAIVESIKLSFEKNSLIKHLKSEITVRQSAEQALSEARDHLEKRVEERTEALRESEQRFRALAEGAPLGIVSIKQDGTFPYVNPRFREMFGYSLEDVPSGREWFRRAYPDPKYRHNVIATWLDDTTRSKTGQIRPRIFTVRCRDGTEKIANFVSVTLHSGESMMTCEDITERRRAEELAVQSERLKAIGDLAGGVAHNFNNLLQMVVGGISIGLTELETGQQAELKKTLETLLLDVMSGAETVKRLQSFARVRREIKAAEDKVFDLSETVKNTAEMTKPLWKTGPGKEGIRITLKLELMERCFVKGKEGEIIEVLVNLIKNAAEALPLGGEIRIKTFFQRDEVVLRVSDNGVGIKRGHLKRVFEPFWSTKGLSIGTGMGLAVSHGIISRHGGGINVESEEGKGATFTVTIPFVEETQEAQTLLGEELSGPKLRILVIDDNPIIVLHFRSLLTKHRHQVFSALSGEEALEIFRNNTIDMVICDLSMPGMNGWEVGRAIRETCRERGLPKTPFILVTGWGGHELEQEKIVESAVDAIVEKPIDNRRLMAVVGEMAKSAELN
jgi:PAS domain S-box-containing protein